MSDLRPMLPWERLAAGVLRCRLKFCDVTIGLVVGRDDVLLIDTGTTLAEARAVARDVRTLSGRDVGHVLLTHNHFDHILGLPVFAAARIHCPPEVVATMVRDRGLLRADAVRHGADPAAVADALEAMVVPQDVVGTGALALGGLNVVISHPGRGHTDHDLIAVVTGAERTVVFCGDLVEESGEPCVDAQSDLAAWPATLDTVVDAGGSDAVYVPGHGAVVDADFVRRQSGWLAARQ